MQNLEGSITKSIHCPVLQNLPIKMPTLAKQQLIVEMVETLEQERKTALQLIENNERLMNALSQHLDEE